MDFTVSDQVVIVGGGPVGFGLALELAMAGVPSTIVEKSATLHHIPKGQNLTQRTVEHFQRWGIESQLFAAATVPRSLGRGVTAYGTLTRGISYDWLRRAAVSQFYSADNLRLPQYRMESVLREKAAQSPLISTLFGWEAGELSQHENGVSLTIRRQTGEIQQLAGRYLVGTDGAGSTIRKQAGLKQNVSDHERRMALLVFRSRRFSALMEEHFPGVGFINVLAPEFEGYWQFFGRVDMGDETHAPSWFFHAPIALTGQLTETQFKAVLEKAVGAEIDVEFLHMGYWNLRFAVAERYRNDRVFIAGDACHSHPPYGGYGVNNGLEDARNLGWKLAAVINGWGTEGLLDSYCEERRPVFSSLAEDFIEKSILDDRAFLESYDPHRDPAAFAAEWGKRADLAAREVDRYAPHYSGSPMICGGAGQTSAIGTHDHAARPGHHLSPVVSADGRALHDLLDSRPACLVASGNGLVERARQAAAALQIPLRIIEIGEADAERLKARAVLLRPDGFVAWTDATEISMEDALATATGRRYCADIGTNHEEGGLHLGTYR